MNQDEFAHGIDRLRTQRPDLFDGEPVKPLDPADRAALERTLGARLPDDFVWFLSEYGGGDFAFANIYSSDLSSDMYLPAKQELAPNLRGRAIVFSDDGTGVLYAFPVAHGVAEDRVITYDFEIDDFGPVDLKAFNDPHDHGFLRFVWNVGIPRAPGEAL